MPVLSSTASNVTSSGFTVSWAASSDAAGVTGYEVQVNGVAYGTTAGTSLPVTGLQPSTSYSVRVRARDAAGNWSALSTVLTAATAVVGAMPVSEPTGFARVFSEDFTTVSPLGSFVVGAAGSATDGRLATSHPYYAKLNLYPDNQGYAGDLSNGRYYTSKVVSTKAADGANGVLDFYWHSETVDGATRALSGWVRPIIPGETSQLRKYGRFSVRMRADATAGFGAVQLLISDNWPAGGEDDWPEGPSTDPVQGYDHYADPAATYQTSGNYQQQVSAPAGTSWQDWHVYTIEWTPGRKRWLLDGVVVRDSTDRVSSVPQKYVIQSGINGSTVPGASVSGHLQVDWMTVADYTGAGSGSSGAVSSNVSNTV